MTMYQQKNVCYLVEVRFIEPGLINKHSYYVSFTGIEDILDYILGARLIKDFERRKLNGVTGLVLKIDLTIKIDSGEIREIATFSDLVEVNEFLQSIKSPPFPSPFSSPSLPP